jgi:membrane associated rhomboid family serine protease
MIPLPYRASIPRRRFPVMTAALIAANTLVWFYELHHRVTLATLDYGLIPSWLLRGIREGPINLGPYGQALLHQEVPFPWTVLTAMFMHGGWLHIIGNMWFLWIFGQGIEDAVGRLRFLTLYFVAGLAAMLAQVLATPTSSEPIVGASGAIAGVMGAYLLLYPTVRVRCIWILIVFVTFVNLPAWALLGLWLVSQFLLPMNSGIAWMAHVGGFVVGLGLVRLLLPRRSIRRSSSVTG